VDFHHHAIGAHGRRRQRQRLDQLPPARRVAGVDDHRQVGALLEHRHRRQVERVAVRVLEGADSALAEDHVVVSLTSHVFGGEQQLLQGRRRSAFEKYG